MHNNKISNTSLPLTHCVAYPDEGLNLFFSSSSNKENITCFHQLT